MVKLKLKLKFEESITSICNMNDSITIFAVIFQCATKVIIKLSDQKVKIVQIQNDHTYQKVIRIKNVTITLVY